MKFYKFLGKKSKYLENSGPTSMYRSRSFFWNKWVGWWKEGGAMCPSLSTKDQHPPWMGVPWWRCGVRNWRECLICTFQIRGNIMLTLYIRATIWKLISFLLLKPIPLTLEELTMKSVPHMDEEVTVYNTL